MLQATVLAVCVAAGAFAVWHCRALYSWLHNLRALALLPHPPSEHWLWGNAQALTKPDFHRRMLQHATEFGAIFSMRLIWFKVRPANFRESPCLAPGSHIWCCMSWWGPSLRALAGVPHRSSSSATRTWWRRCFRATPRLTSPSHARHLPRATSPSAWYVRAGGVLGARADQPGLSLLGAADQQPREDAEHAHAEQQVRALAACA